MRFQARLGSSSSLLVLQAPMCRRGEGGGVQTGGALGRGQLGDGGSGRGSTGGGAGEVLSEVRKGRRGERKINKRMTCGAD
jgi:hypothetical protein